MKVTDLTCSPIGQARGPWEDAETPQRFNIASYLPARAAERPFQQAVVMPQGRDALGKRLYSHLTFAQLDRLCDAYAHGLVQEGFSKGERTLLMVSQGLELIALTYALFKIGAVPILIDPGMGRAGFLACIERAQPTAMLGIPRAFVAKTLFGKSFKTVRKSATTKSVFFSSAPELNKIAKFSAGPFEMADTDREDLAAILFTSGSTGPAKGVQYTHGIFDAQTRAIQAMYAIQPGEVAVPGFPLFALFSTAMGMTCVVPDMDPSSPASVHPPNIVEAIHDFGASMAFGSPAIWNAVGTYCKAEGISFPSMTRLLTFGAPISPNLMETYQAILPNGEIHTPYGATEGLPVASIGSRRVLEETAEKSRIGQGICVGKAAPNVEIRIIEISDEPIETWAGVKELEVGKIGEICVAGPQITRRYDQRDDATLASKILDPSLGEGGFWHRMGDVGYLDQAGDLWFCGRKAHRVESAEGVMHSVPVEAVFEVHPKVFRIALVGIGERGTQEPVLVVECLPGEEPKSPAEMDGLAEELLKIGQKFEHTRNIVRMLFHPAFPVDKRHNAKIHREELAEWVSVGKTGMNMQRQSRLKE